jgi:hypothetical protein
VPETKRCCSSIRVSSAACHMIYSMFAHLNLRQIIEQDIASGAASRINAVKFRLCSSLASRACVWRWCIIIIMTAVVMAAAVVVVVGSVEFKIDAHRPLKAVRSGPGERAVGCGRSGHKSAFEQLTHTQNGRDMNTCASHRTKGMCVCGGGGSDVKPRLLSATYKRTLVRAASVDLGSCCTQVHRMREKQGSEEKTRLSYRQYRRFGFFSRSVVHEREDPEDATRLLDLNHWLLVLLATCFRGPSLFALFANPNGHKSNRGRGRSPRQNTHVEAAE